MNSSNNKIIIILILIILTMFGGLYHYHNKLSELETNMEISEQNNTALKDSIQRTRNKVNDLEYSKSVLISEKNELAKLNEDLDIELQKEKGNVSSLTTTVISLKNKLKELEVDVEYLPPREGEEDSIYRINWRHQRNYDDNNSRSLAGYSVFKINDEDLTIFDVESFLTEDDIQFKLVQGLRERDGVVEVFARSDYPGFGVEKMHSAIIDPSTHPVFTKFTNREPKRFGLALYTGYGLTYNFKQTTALHGFQIGAGLYWRPKIF